jgi:ubiquinol-cytochrome c reductase iron-sulfur subunit/rieske iron-sulfur protein
MAGLVAAPALAQDGSQADPASAGPQLGDYLVLASGDDQVTPLKPEDIVPNSAPVEAWPADSATQTVRDGSYQNLLVLTRWDPAVLSPEGQEYAAGGVVAQSAICTHEGCEVTSWVAESFLLECPCHLSRFDPRQNGAVMQGPAMRKLAAIPLKLDGDRIVVAGAFDARVG